MLVNAISLKPFPQSTSNLKFVFILSIGHILLILGHLLNQDGCHGDLKSDYSLRCEHDTSSNSSLTDSNFENLCIS